MNARFERVKARREEMHVGESDKLRNDERVLEVMKSHGDSKKQTNKTRHRTNQNKGRVHVL